MDFATFFKLLMAQLSCTSGKSLDPVSTRTAPTAESHRENRRKLDENQTAKELHALYSQGGFRMVLTGRAPS